MAGLTAENSRSCAPLVLRPVGGLTPACGPGRGVRQAAAAKVASAVRVVAARVPPPRAIKDVKRRWGHGQEDVFPVAQFEKLWGDLTALPDLPCAFLAVDRDDFVFG